MRIRGLRQPPVCAAALLCLGCVIAIAGGCKPDNSAAAPGTQASADGGSDAPVTGSVIPVGEYGSMTGSEATFGKSTDDGIQLATDQLNKAGGIDGKQVQLSVEDDMSDAPHAETAVQRLIDQKHVIAVLGEVASGSSLAAGPVCQQAGVPMVSPSSTNLKVTQIGNDIFRVCFIDSFQAAVVARFAHDGLNVTRIAIFTDKTSPYSVGFAQAFKDAFTKMGGQIVAEQSYGKDDKDYRGALTAIQSANPQAILVPGYYTNAGAIAKQARDLGITVPLLGGDGWDSQALFQTGGSAVNGCYFSDHVAMDDPSPRVQDFVKAYQARFGHKPDALAALGYDAAGLLYDAMKHAKSLDKADIRDAIAQTKDYPGVTGNITIDENRNASKPAVIIKVADQGFHFVTQIADPSKPLSQQPKAAL